MSLVQESGQIQQTTINDFEEEITTRSFEGLPNHSTTSTISSENEFTTSTISNESNENEFTTTTSYEETSSSTKNDESLLNYLLTLSRTSLTGNFFKSVYKL